MPAGETTRRPWRVGLTGGIASGKTTVARLFAALGVPVIDTDEIARAVVTPGTPLLASIRERFGAGVIAPDGSLDRRALRDRVFADAQLRRELEALTHPAIRTEMETRSAIAGGRYQLIVIPLLIETGAASQVDRVLVVDCSEDNQLRRLRARDGCSREQAAAMLAAQAPRSARLAAAHDVITNEGDLAALRDEVERLHARYLELAARP
ncbi:MAG: dephospho-CoA kinase [Steroidobacteraceae bacterium]